MKYRVVENIEDMLVLGELKKRGPTEESVLIWRLKSKCRNVDVNWKAVLNRLLRGGFIAETEILEEREFAESLRALKEKYGASEGDTGKLCSSP